MDREFTGAFPRYSGAISSVTDGPPEDINEMPATLNPDVEGTIYDGSHLNSADETAQSTPAKSARIKPGEQGTF